MLYLELTLLELVMDPVQRVHNSSPHLMHCLLQPLQEGAMLTNSLFAIPHVQYDRQRQTYSIEETDCT